MTTWGIAIGLVACAATVSFGLGWNLGKQTLLIILRGHESDGKTLKEALDYEIAVMNGKKPFEEPR